MFLNPISYFMLATIWYKVVCCFKVRAVIRRNKFCKMNVYKLRNICNCRNFLLKSLTPRAAHTAVKTESDIEPLTKQDPKVSTDVGGITVVSCENYSPISQVSVVFKAGPRYENPHNLGVVHCLRNCAALATKTQSALSLTRDLELKGSKLNVTATRENLIYNLQAVRDELDPSLEVLADIISNPAYKPWEVKDSTHRMHLDLALLDNNPEAVLMEALHKAAFRNGLGNSLFSPSFMVGKHSTEMILNYVNENFSVSKAAVVGLGVGHDHLESAVYKLFNIKNSSVTEDAAKFSGGEVIVEKDIPFVHAAIVAEGSSSTNTKDALSLGLLQCILSNCDGNQTKFGGSRFSKLGEAASKSTNEPFNVSSLNVNYSDTGFFGVYICAVPDDMKQVTKSVVSQMREVTKSITDADVQSAKHQLKTKIRLARETSSDVMSSMISDAFTFKQVRSIKDIEKTIDGLTTSDVSSIASKVMKTKPALAAVGRLHGTPHIDELL